MKKTEIILGIIALIAISFNLLFLPGGSELTILSLSALSTLYFYLSFALFNEIKLRRIFKKESYQNISKMKIIGAVFTGFALSITTVGLLFKFMSWPGADLNLGIGIIGLTVTLVLTLIKYLKLKSKFYGTILIRILIIGGVALTLLLMSKSWLEIKYRNYPNYINAVKKAQADPNNQVLWNEVDLEREKIRKQN